MVTNQKRAKEEKYLLQKLPLPPCLFESTRKSFHDIQIPLPPRTFQPSSRSCSRKGLKRHDQDDPFLAACKECTRATHKGRLSKKGVGFGLERGMFGFSCKQSCSVRGDNLVLTSLIPIEKGERKKGSGNKWNHVNFDGSFNPELF
ncbi:hypothetical protein SLA2020_152990 [Shorea laevis]